MESDDFATFIRRYRVAKASKSLQSLVALPDKGKRNCFEKILRHFNGYRKN